MPTYEFGDMWSVYNETDAFLFTGNSYLRKDGALVMGRGLARQVRDRVKGSDQRFGRAIKEMSGHLGEYNVAWSTKASEKIGVFQVKYHFKDDADLSLIERSAEKLHQQIRKYPPNRVDLNFPGIGNGGQSVSDVKPIIDSLPDCVHIWRYRS